MKIDESKLKLKNLWIKNRYGLQNSTFLYLIWLFRPGKGKPFLNNTISPLLVTLASKCWLAVGLMGVVQQSLNKLVTEFGCECWNSMGIEAYWTHLMIRCKCSGHLQCFFRFKAFWCYNWLLTLVLTERVLWKWAWQCKVVLSCWVSQRWNDSAMMKSALLL